MNYCKEVLDAKSNTIKQKLKEEFVGKSDTFQGKLKDEIEERSTSILGKFQGVKYMGVGVLRNLLRTDVPSNRVKEAQSNNYSSRSIHLREDALVLYLPIQSTTNNSEKNQYEIVLHRPYTETLHQIYSLYRTSNIADAETKFFSFRTTLLIFVDICKEMYSVQGLQKICDVLGEHPSWNLAHLAAYFGLNEAFKDHRVNAYMNSTDETSGLSPLQVAISSKNLKTVQLLVAADCSLQHLDRNQDSVFHYAANSTKDIITALSQGGSGTTPPCCLNMRNTNGYTPLHIACQADKPECVKALLLAGADVNKTSGMNSPNTERKPGYVGNFVQTHPNSLYKADMKSGGTPLHWASSRSVVEALLDVGCHIDVLNFEQRTALHIMVMRNRLECVVALLSHHAQTNVNDVDGNTPLHLAVKSVPNIAIIQALIIFGANLDALNGEGQSPRHIISSANDPQRALYYIHAVGAKRCTTGVFNCGEGCRPGGTYNGVPPPSVAGATKRSHLNHMLAVAGMDVASKSKSSAKKSQHRNTYHGGRVLCLDGGGIRGLVLAVMLIEIEKMMQKPIVECFDWLAGTSTGGILALGIAAGKTLHECLCLYFRIKEKTFVGLRPYASEPLENVLKDTFGPETVMTDLRYPKVMVTGVLADRKPVELHLFRNYASANEILGVDHDSPYEKPSHPDDQFVWQVGRATGAAPTYFRAFGRFLDGGLIANNPTLDAMSEIHEYNLALKAVGKTNLVEPLSVVCSLGTGVIPTSPVSDIDVFLPGSLFDGFKLYTGMTALGAMLVDQATATDGRVVERARAWCSTIGVPYYRFSPQLSEDIAMNECSDEKLCKMLWETKVYMYEHKAYLQELVDFVLTLG